MIFTATQKLEAVRRELKMRQRVYPFAIERGTVTPHEAKFQISIMEAIAEDYERLAQGERLL